MKQPNESLTPERWSYLKALKIRPRWFWLSKWGTYNKGKNRTKRLLREQARILRKLTRGA